MSGVAEKAGEGQPAGLHKTPPASQAVGTPEKGVPPAQRGANALAPKSVPGRRRAVSQERLEGRASSPRPLSQDGWGRVEDDGSDVEIIKIVYSEQTMRKLRRQKRAAAKAAPRAGSRRKVGGAATPAGAASSGPGAGEAKASEPSKPAPEPEEQLAAGQEPTFTRAEECAPEELPPPEQAQPEQEDTEPQDAADMEEDESEPESRRKAAKFDSPSVQEQIARGVEFPPSPRVARYDPESEALAQYREDLVEADQEETLARRRAARYQIATISVPRTRERTKQQEDQSTRGLRALSTAAAQGALTRVASDPEYAGGYFVSADLRSWSVVRGSEMFQHRALYLGAPGAMTFADLRHKELWFLVRWKADIWRVVRRLRRRSFARIVRTAKKYDWGTPPPAFKSWHKKRAKGVEGDLSAEDLCDLWPSPFVAHHWVWHEQYYREFPEVVRLSPRSEEWTELATDYSADYVRYLHPAYERYLRTGELVAPCICDCNIPRSGNIPEDIQACIDALRPDFRGDGRPMSCRQLVYHTLPVAPAPASHLQVPLKLSAWMNEPRPDSLYTAASAVPEHPRDVHPAESAPSDSSGESEVADCEEEVEPSSDSEVDPAASWRA